MNTVKKRKLESEGWKVGSVSDLLGLSAEERSLIEMKLSLAVALKKRRMGFRWTQSRLAQRLETSQSRVAKMEAADPSVSMDLLVHALLTVGATRLQLGRIISKQAAYTDRD